MREDFGLRGLWDTGFFFGYRGMLVSEEMRQLCGDSVLAERSTVVIFEIFYADWYSTWKEIFDGGIEHLIALKRNILFCEHKKESEVILKVFVG